MLLRLHRWAAVFLGICQVFDDVCHVLVGQKGGRKEFFRGTLLFVKILELVPKVWVDCCELVLTGLAQILVQTFNSVLLNVSVEDLVSIELCQIGLISCDTLEMFLASCLCFFLHDLLGNLPNTYFLSIFKQPNKFSPVGRLDTVLVSWIFLHLIEGLISEIKNQINDSRINLDVQPTFLKCVLNVFLLVIFLLLNIFSFTLRFHLLDTCDSLCLQLCIDFLIFLSTF